MKKYFRILLVLLVAILLVGCSSDSEKDNDNNVDTGNEETVIKKCTLNQDNSAQGYALNSTYEIYAKGQVVEKVITKEVVNSSDQDILNYFEEQLKKTYDTASAAYGGYKYSVVKDTDSVTSDVEINYSKMDMDKFVKDTPSMSNYLNAKNQMTLSGITMLYKSLGATCE